MMPPERERSPLVFAARDVRERFFCRIGRLADDRLHPLKEEFEKRFPRRRLEIVFGNGSECVLIDDRMANEDGTIKRKHGGGWQVWRGLGFIFDALNDIHEITDGYTHGCPDNIKVNPRRKR